MWQLYECKLIRWIRKQSVIYLLILYSGELGELRLARKDWTFPVYLCSISWTLAVVHLNSFEATELLPGQI